MTMSLDGFVQDADGGSGGLYSDFDVLMESDYMERIQAETGAVLMGRRTYDGAADPDGYADNYEFQVPIFVLTHRPPDRAPKSNDRLSITFVTDGIEAAVAQAREAAGDKAVTVVGGASVNQQLLAAGLMDEINVDVMPVLLGNGLRFFADAAAGVQLEKTSVEEVGVRTSLRFRVVR